MKPALITGGAGFIGSNLADRLASDGRDVLIFDNLSRCGVEENLAWLKETHPSRVRFVREDVRDAEALRYAVKSAGAVFHFAAQVAVTTSLTDPRCDFDTNVIGTFNVLEALRQHALTTPLVYTSTNKVYGSLPDVELCIRGQRYEPAFAELACSGISERRALDFHTPYGCAKGSADQYVIDYARSFGLQACVFRMSCIYGPHQFGTEDQGWVAHFLIRAQADEPITIFGDGMQVRDILFVEDLVEAFLLAEHEMHGLAGQAFNMGGGVPFTVSLLELVAEIERLHGKRPRLIFEDARKGDQRYYVSDCSKFRTATGWGPVVGPHIGIAALNRWLLSARSETPAALRAS